MKFLSCLLTISCATIVFGQYYRPPIIQPNVEESQFAYQLKSFRQSLDECAQYLDLTKDNAVERLLSANYLTTDKDLKCLIRCAGINAGWWNESASIGVQGPVMESYFQPSAKDTHYARRTEECIKAKLAPCRDDCHKAYEAFLCYYHQYGDLKRSEEYVPLQPLEAVQAAIDCINVLRIPKHLIQEYSNGVFAEVHQTKCLYRCQYLAEGLYDPQLGLNLTRIYIRNRAVPDREILSERSRSCVEYALRDNRDECSRVYRARNCLASFGVQNQTSDIFKQAALNILAQQQDEAQSIPRYSERYGAQSYNQPQSRYVTQPEPESKCRYNCNN
ncbi:general odorant-binding protein 45-like [Malaya genurostris]|uniref:general odorant-binding protein 45-like n=1 Tax=Malaya genurostris TaxID=325434 RepID=UPI0026F3FFC0|nr:general odorant-binding protein 45-like [Malaya genurostris]